MYLRGSKCLQTGNALNLGHDVLGRMKVTTVLPLTTCSEEVPTRGHCGVKILPDMWLCGQNANASKKKFVNL